MPSKILIIDDHPVVRQGIKMFIETEKSFKVCGEAGSIDEAVNQINKLKPDLAIVDLSLDGDLSGLELIKAISKRFPEIKSLVLSMHDENIYAERSLRAGARGYIMKKEAQQNIIKAIHKILGGGLYLSESIQEKIIGRIMRGNPEKESNPVPLLSDREFEVFQLIGQGLNSADIAKKIKMQKNTVDSHKRHIKEKLNLKNSTELTRFAAQWSLTGGK